MKTKGVFDHRKTEKYWQEKWLKDKVFYPPNMLKAKKPFYNLWMYPYPSAEGLHAGHAFASTGSDVFGRFMRMKEFDVFQPIGYDSFGLHSENFAIQIGQHPKDMLARTTKNYERQLKSLGHGYDWTRTVTVSNIEYYRWTQWLFVEIFKAGLAFRKESSVNWCPSCKTVVADEQVIAGSCERCNSEVESRDLEQWFFRITDYADRLLENLSKIDWSDRVVIAQRNWIGKSEGTIIKFSIFNSQFSIESFTTRPDTLYGATFFVLAPEHPIVNKLLNSKFKIQGAKLKEVKKYVERSKKISKEDRVESRNKTGVFTGLYVINPATGKKIPVYVADYVLMDYGTGAIMGVPAHDQRDWDFAKRNNLPIVKVIKGGNVKKEAYDGSGKLINSGNWNGIAMPEKINQIISDVKKRNWGEGATTYHLRDWLISRQRYWGPPIPMIFCKNCAKKRVSYSTTNSKLLLHKDQSDWKHFGWWPEENLPVELPYYKDYKPKGTGRGPLEDHPEFYKTKCPYCKGTAKRETDVSDTFVDSSWYFLRYPSTRSPRSGRVPFDKKITNKWLPVNLYFGGAEHSVLHLMYSRFITMVLYDLGHIHFEEPFPNFFAHGLMIKDGAKMSKSKGNVVSPDDYIEKFGADTLRLYLMFMGPMDGYPDFRDTGIEGMRRFIERVWDLFQSDSTLLKLRGVNQNEILIKMHQTIKKVTDDIENFRYNTAISAIMEYVNVLRDKVQNSKFKIQNDNSKAETKDKIQNTKDWQEALKTLVLLIAPFAPYLAEEVWVNVLKEKYSIHTANWPKFDPGLVKKEVVTVAIQVNGKLRATLELKTQNSKLRTKVIRAARADERIKKWLKGKRVKKTIFVPDRLINFVV